MFAQIMKYFHHSILFNQQLTTYELFSLIRLKFDDREACFELRNFVFAAIYGFLFLFIVVGHYYQ